MNSPPPHSHIAFRFVHILILLLVFAFTLGARIYWLSQKEGFMVDEPLSITLACYNEYMWSSNYELNREYTGKEVKEISLCDNDRLRNVAGDIKRLWENNRDSAHTNLYYSFLRISLAGLKTGNIQKIIFRAGFLNLVFFSGSFFFLYSLLRLLFPGRVLLNIVALFCTFMSTASISNTLLFRSYQLQETIFIVFCYFFIKSFNWKKYALINDRLYVSHKLFVLMSFITAITLLTGYYAIIFVGFFGVYIMYLGLRKTRDINEVLVYVSLFIAGIILAQLFYSRYVQGFLSPRAAETRETLLGNFAANITSAFLCAVNLLNTHYFTYPVVTMIVLCLLYLKLTKKKIMIGKHTMFIFISSMLYMIIIIYLAPYKTLRYVMPVFPFFILLPFTFINSIENRKLSAIMMVSLVVCFLPPGINGHNIEFIYKDKQDDYLFAKCKETPVFVINKSYWKYAELVPYFNDEQSYFFTDSIDENVIEQYDAFYLVVENTPEMKEIERGTFEVDSEFSISYFLCRKMIRNKQKNTL
jgi:hypothetical protein